MAIRVSWDSKAQNVIRYDFDKTWTAQDFEHAVEQSFTMTESVEHTVDVIMDFSRCQELPHGFILYLKRKMMVLPANRGSIVVAGTHPAVRSTLQMFRRIHKSLAQRISAADSLKEARALLASDLPATAPLKSPGAVFTTVS